MMRNFQGSKRPVARPAGSSLVPLRARQLALKPLFWEPTVSASLMPTRALTESYA